MFAIQADAAIPLPVSRCRFPMVLPLHRSTVPKHRLTALLAGCLLLLSACAVNPATGERQFTALLPAEQEASLGAEEHPKILAEFGGAYEDPELQAMLDRLGQRLAAGTERPEVSYTFTLLDSDVVNAFALPGGYVYVTRGLLALANSEAQLAGVVGHEIAHITARHTAERYSRGTLAQIGAVLAGVFGGQQIGQAAAAGAQLILAGWSRDQELEADRLGLRYMAQLGYDPLEMARFLDTMGRHAQLQALLAGKPGAADTFSYLQTHPPTGNRVERAVEIARTVPGTPARAERDAYLRALDGVIYGDSPENGFVRDRVFAHPGLGFRFEVPEGFRLLNGQRTVTAVGPQENTLIVFDAAPTQGAADPAAFIRNVWAPQAPLAGLERIEINGLPAATARSQVRSQAGALDARLVAIRWDADTFYRFLFLNPAGLTGGLSVPFRETTYSFRALTAAERAGLRPYRIEVVEVRPGQTVADFVRRMPFDDYAEERFRVLNDIAPGTGLQAGRLVKIVTGG